ncbi:MAG: hypothetical protein V4558_08900 [Gemmatimonadota bacterium]
MASLLLAITGCSTGAPRSATNGAASSGVIPEQIISARDTTPACPQCVIALDSLTTLGLEDDSVTPRDPTSVVQGADQLFYVAPMSEQGRVGVYGWDGHLVRLLGRTGDGPGELRWAASVAAAPDGSLGVLDFNRILWYPLLGGAPITQVLDQPLGEFRTLALPGRGLVVATEQSMPGRAFVYVDSLGNRRDFGDSLKARATVGDGFAPHSLAASGGGHFYAMPWYNTPRIDEWDTNGRLLRRYQLPAPWFTPYGIEPLRELQRVGVRGLRLAISSSAWRDRAGLLWTITNVADPRWKVVADIGQKDELGARQPLLSGYDKRLVQDAIIAVYRVTDTSVALVASRRVDMPLSRFLSDSVVAERTQAGREDVGFNLFRYRLRGLLQ